jgi:hypothetical protein
LSPTEVGSAFDTSCVTSKRTAPIGSLISSNSNATYSCGDNNTVGVATDWIVYQNANLAQASYNRTLNAYMANATQFVIDGNSAFYNLLEYNGTKVANVVCIVANQLMIADYAPYNATTEFPSMSALSGLVSASLNAIGSSTASSSTNALNYFHFAGEVTGVVVVVLLLIFGLIRLRRGSKNV